MPTICVPPPPPPPTPNQFSVFLGLIFFLELAAGILAFVFKDWIRDQLNLFINNNVKAYRDDIDLQNLIDFAQEYVSVAPIMGLVQMTPDGHIREGGKFCVCTDHFLTHPGQQRPGKDPLRAPVPGEASSCSFPRLPCA